MTPPLRHSHGLGSLTFSLDDRRVLGALGNGETFAFRLAPDPRPIEDLARLSVVLSGRQLSGRTALVTGPATDMANDWSMLQRKHPAAFQIPREQLLAGHEEAALAAERDCSSRAADTLS